jgi:hypothetical protein
MAMTTRLSGIAAALAAVLICACGHDSDNGSANTGKSPDGGTTTPPPPPPPSQVALDVQTNGNGMVRGAGPDCRGSCHATYDSGTKVHLEAIPDSGYIFSRWNGACTGTGACDLTLGANMAVTATFAAAPPTMRRLTVTVGNQGSVTSQPAGIDCPGTACNADFADGTTVTLTAAPASGWVFGGWSDACSGSTECSIKMDGAKAVHATFNPPPPPPPPAKAHLIVSVEGNGQITGSGINCGFGATTCDVTVDAGKAMSLNAVAGGQARFMGWTGVCSGSGPDCSFTAKDEMRITAKFWDVLTTLVANDGTNLGAIAINSTDVFYSRSTGDGGSSWAVSKSGGQPRKIAQGYGSAMVADDGYVYWADYYSIYSAPVGGGSASQIYANGQGISRLALDSDGALYFTTLQYTSNGWSGAVNRMQNRVTTQLVSGIRTTIGIGVDDKYVYFGMQDVNNVGYLQRVLKTGGSAETLHNCGQSCQVSAIKPDGGWVFYRNLQTGETWTIEKKAGAHPIQLSGQNGYYYDAEIDGNGETAYWNNAGSYNGQSPNGIFSVFFDGANAKTWATGSDQNWHGPRVDGTAVYYWHAGALLRQLK